MAVLLVNLLHFYLEGLKVLKLNNWAELSQMSGILAPTLYQNIKTTT